MFSTDILALIVFLFCIILFVIDRLPMATTAILGCVLMVVFNLCSFSSAFGQFASSTVILLISIFVVSSAISETGLAGRLGSLVLNIAKNDERRIMVVAYFSAALFSMFLSNATVLAIYIPIIMGIGARDRRIQPMNLIMPVALGCNMGGISTLVGSTQQMTAHGLIEEAGLSWDVFSFTPFGGILITTGLLYTLFIGYPLGKRIWGGREADPALAAHAENRNHHREYDKKKAPMVAVIFIAMVVCYITKIVPTAIAASGAALLCIITGCVSQDRAVSQINWNIVGRLGGCLGLAKALDAAGSIQRLANFAGGILGEDFSPFLLFAIAVLAVQVFSLFISNSTAVLVVLPIVISLAPSMGLNISSYAMGIAVGSSIGMCCPLSGSTLGIAMVAGYRFRDFLRYGLLFDILGYLLILIFIPMLFPLVLA